MRFIKRIIISFIQRIIMGFIIAALFVASYFFIMEYIVGGFTQENMKPMLIVTGVYVLLFVYLFINTPMKYALIVTAFTGLGSELAKELVSDAAMKSVEDELERY